MCTEVTKRYLVCVYLNSAIFDIFWDTPQYGRPMATGWVPIILDTEIIL